MTSETVGRWNDVYRDASERNRYGMQRTYEVAAEFFKDTEVVEDWGCGYGYFSEIRKGKVVSIDGSASPFADIVQDLAERQPENPGVLLKNVLEHNPNWRTILDKATRHPVSKLCVVLCVDPSDGDDIPLDPDRSRINADLLRISERDLLTIFSAAGFAVRKVKLRKGPDSAWKWPHYWIYLGERQR